MKIKIDDFDDILVFWPQHVIYKFYICFDILFGFRMN